MSDAAETAAAPAPATVPPRRRGPLRRVARGAAWLLVALAVALAAGGGWLYVELRASLPVLEGEQALAGLGARVEVTRDALGVPTISAATALDAARALGYLHAQERFFQMDLLRRQAAGELAALIGPAVVSMDRDHRLHRFRDRARQVLAQASAGDRAIAQAYTAGVNAGLAALGAVPVEYLALRATPSPWAAEDSVLVVAAMYFDLQGGTGRIERNLSELQRRLPPELFAFLTPAGTEWDAPLTGGPFAQPPVPGPGVIDLRGRATQTGMARLGHGPEPPEPAGSNNWAVAGTHTADGKALVADDMHLGLSVPNVWYRVRMQWQDGGQQRHITGVSLPGGPAVVAGSNGHVAWAFTNSQGDWIDLVVVEPDPADASRYLVPGGSEPFGTVRETIAVKGGPTETLDIRTTRWGPLVEPDSAGRQLAVSWVAHHPDALTFAGLFGLQTASTLDEALREAHRAGVPAQNFTVADASGRIAWTIIGFMPRRVGFDGRLPVSWADGTRRWDGWLTPEEVPAIVDPPSGRIWTANHRLVDGEMLARLGEGGYALGARGRQIRDDLLAIDKATPEDLLRIQLDDRAVFLDRWRTLLLQVITPAAVAADPKRQALRRLTESTWTGHASIDSAAYRIVRAFRASLADRVWDAVTGQAGAADDTVIPSTTQFEGPLWALVSARPAHVVPAGIPGWDAWLLAAVDDTIAELEKAGPDLAQRTWGERNTVRVRHPLSRAVPQLGRFLDVPPRQLPGDSNMPRVQAPTFGASQRFVVSPGQEEKGFFHMPVGQSGHPLSPYYRNGHGAWEEGQPTPFLPGPAVHRLILNPM